MQLYTVRDLMKDDFDGTIAKVAPIGYKEVEFAGYFGRTPQQVRAALDKNGLDRALHPRSIRRTRRQVSFRHRNLQNDRPEIHCLPLDSRGAAQVSRHLEAGRREIQPLRRGNARRPACSLPITITGSNFFPSTASFLTMSCSSSATPIW